MKKSNKLLLVTAAILVALLLCTQWNLYDRFKHHQYTIDGLVDSTNLVRREMPAPHYLSIKGVYIASIIPSDTFAIEYSKIVPTDEQRVFELENTFPLNAQEVARHAAPRYERIGDTLVIDGYDTLDRKNAIGQPLLSKALWVRVYCRNLDLIRLNVQKAYLEGDSITIHAPTRLELKNTNLELGATYPVILGPIKRTWFDSISISSLNNSSVALREYIYVDKLHIQFTHDQSSFSDERAKIGQLQLDWFDENSLHLTGENLRKLQTKR